MMNTSKKLSIFDYDKIKDKYFQIAKTQGQFAAISAIHNELGKIESHVFDGGFDSERLDHLQRMREICRELWTSKYKI